ncbi:hypothetical protein Tco_0431785 [Tanacetum coccineum]
MGNGESCQFWLDHLAYRGIFKTFSRLYRLNHSKKLLVSSKIGDTEFSSAPSVEFLIGVSSKINSQLGRIGLLLSVISLPSADRWNWKSGEYGYIFRGGLLLVERIDEIRLSEYREETRWDKSCPICDNA